MVIVKTKTKKYIFLESNWKYVINQLKSAWNLLRMYWESRRRKIGMSQKVRQNYPDETWNVLGKNWESAKKVQRNKRLRTQKVIESYRKKLEHSIDFDRFFSLLQWVGICQDLRFFLFTFCRNSSSKILLFAEIIELFQVWCDMLFVICNVYCALWWLLNV